MRRGREERGARRVGSAARRRQGKAEQRRAHPFDVTQLPFQLFHCNTRALDLPLHVLGHLTRGRVVSFAYLLRRKAAIAL